jgi:predicted nucleotidyltransferase
MLQLADLAAKTDKNKTDEIIRKLIGKLSSYDDAVYSKKFQQILEAGTYSHLRPSLLVSMHRETILQILDHFGAKNPRIFGSVANGTDTEESDLNILLDDPSPPFEKEIEQFFDAWQIVLRLLNKNEHLKPYVDETEFAEEVLDAIQHPYKKNPYSDSSNQNNDNDTDDNINKRSGNHGLKEPNKLEDKEDNKDDKDDKDDKAGKDNKDAEYVLTDSDKKEATSSLRRIRGQRAKVFAIFIKEVLEILLGIEVKVETTNLLSDHYKELIEKEVRDL